MKKRWISLYVENNVGVLCKVAGLFSGKAYNLETLTVGTTEDPTVSRMTIGVESDDVTFEQIKKQLNRCVEVIKVLDFTTNSIHMKELMFIKVMNCSSSDVQELFQIAQIKLIRKHYKHIEVVRGGSVAIESLSMTDR